MKVIDTSVKVGKIAGNLFQNALGKYALFKGGGMVAAFTSSTPIACVALLVIGGATWAHSWKTPISHTWNWLKNKVSN